jgi:hypothetical protein
MEDHDQRIADAITLVSKQLEAISENIRLIRQAIESPPSDLKARARASAGGPPGNISSDPPGNLPSSEPPASPDDPNPA